MKNLLLLAISFLFICCSSVDESKQKEILVPQIKEETKEDYTYTLGDVMVKWTHLRSIIIKLNS